MSGREKQAARPQLLKVKAPLFPEQVCSFRWAGSIACSTRGSYVERVGAGAPVYLAAVFDANGWGLRINQVMPHVTTRRPASFLRHLQLAIRNDERLYKLLGVWLLLRLSVLPKSSLRSYPKKQEPPSQSTEQVVIVQNASEQSKCLVKGQQPKALFKAIQIWRAADLDWASKLQFSSNRLQKSPVITTSCTMKVFGVLILCEFLEAVCLWALKMLIRWKAKLHSNTLFMAHFGEYLTISDLTHAEKMF